MLNFTIHVYTNEVTYNRIIELFEYSILNSSTVNNTSIKIYIINYEYIQFKFMKDI